MLCCAALCCPQVHEGHPLHQAVSAVQSAGSGSRPQAIGSYGLWQRAPACPPGCPAGALPPHPTPLTALRLLRLLPARSFVHDW